MSGIDIDRLDHLVLTVRDIEESCDFYARVLGMEVVEFAGGRKALNFGRHKINLHQAGAEFEPKAQRPTPGSADMCLITTQHTDDVVQHLDGEGVTIIEGPVDRTGAEGPITSVYFNDPDGNLIEVSRYKD